MNIYDCLYLENNGVSGAAIYNAFGLLNVNNSKFIKNNAISFYGGAIYNTDSASMVNCTYNKNQACTAEAINVSGDNVVVYTEANCSTFKHV